MSFHLSADSVELPAPDPVPRWIVGGKPSAATRASGTAPIAAIATARREKIVGSAFRRVRSFLGAEEHHRSPEIREDVDVERVSQKHVLQARR